jgi:hypothetical protein
MANAKASLNEEQFSQQMHSIGRPWNANQSWLQPLSWAPEIHVTQ